MDIIKVLATELTAIGIDHDITDLEANDLEANYITELRLTFPSGKTITLLPGSDFPDEPSMPVLFIKEGEF